MKDNKIWETIRNSICLLMVVVLAYCSCITSVSVAFAEDIEDGIDLFDNEDWEEDDGTSEDPDELRVGHPTVIKGDFFTEMFGNDTSDIDVRALIHGYNLVNWDQMQGVYVFDTSVVREVKILSDKEGNPQYFIALYDDLYYSDGSPITAWDYAFSLLLLMASEIEEIGGRVYRAEHIFGYDEYITGKQPYLSGVNVISDHQLVITLDHEFLPYFFETGLLLCVPYPISEIAPGCKVYDDGYGVYIGNTDKNVEEPRFTAELLRETILDPDTGYNSHPSVVSGPYVLTEYDGTTAHFEINPYFKGTMNGFVPTIPKISFSLADNDTISEDLKNEKFHLVNKIVYAPTIMECMQITEPAIRRDNYPRIGLMCLTFSYDWPTVHEKEVRQAIAWCMDREEIMHDYCGDFGMTMDGFFGIEQWEYQIVTGRMSPPISSELSDAEIKAEEEKWAALNLDNLTKYSVDIDKANQLLDDAGWTLNRQGETYRPDEDDVRCKIVDGVLTALDLKMMYPEGNHVVEFLQESFIDNLNKCGILLTCVPADMQELLRSFYREKERETDMIYVATNFHVIVDPAIEYSTDTSANHEMWNNTYSDDEELYLLAVDMRRTTPGDAFTYVEKWIRFQERFNEVLPVIPIYSNIYYDFFNPKLQNYHITAHVTWSQAIVESTFGEESAEETDELEFEDDESVEYFGFDD